MSATVPSRIRSVRPPILVVEDSRAMQEKLTAILRQMEHLELVGLAETARDAKTRCREAGADRFFSKAPQHRELSEELLRFTA